MDRLPTLHQAAVEPQSGEGGTPPSPDSLDDTALVEQAKQDPHAFGVLYQRYVDRIYAYIYHRVHNVQDAEDLTARTFERALEHLPQYEDRGAPFSAWLYRIAHNLVANWHRDRSRRRFVPIEGLHLRGKRGEEPEVAVEQEEEHRLLWEAIEQLPPERRDLLIYKFGSRLSNLEIGRIMNRSEGAIKSLYFRTLAALRQEMKRRLGAEPSAPGDEEERSDA